MSAEARTCVRCQRPLTDSLFCQFDGAFILDPDGTVVMASRGERILSWFVNALLVIFTLFIGWVIWWFIVAPKGQNPGKAVTGLRVIRTNGDAVTTGGMFVRGLVGQIAGWIPFFLDDLWMFFDKNAQTIHDKVVDSVVVKAKGSEKIVENGHLPGALPPPPSYAPYAPPVSLPTSQPARPPTTWQSSEDKLRALDDLKAKGLITEEEYQERRKAILEKF
jgi:uncharacterized RDD family membrane protein YckC